MATESGDVDRPVTTSSPSPGPRRRRWHFGTRTIVTLLVAVVAIESWAALSKDPDFYLPDPFRPLALGLIALFVATAFIPRSWIRRALRSAALALVAALLVLEMHSRFRENGVDRVMRTADILQRYQYRPGAEIHSHNGPVVTVNHLGLMDVEHAIPKPPDVYRIVVLTGSIANDGAIPFQERFFRRLESQLADLVPGKRVEVINVSCEGYNVVQQVRLLEHVGLQYEPDLVIEAFMLTAAAIQDGSYRRIGNSFYAFRFLPLVAYLETGSLCSTFAPFFQNYSYELIVRNSFERLALLAQLHHFRTLVAVLPVVERFDDPVCTGIYDQVVGTARQSGLPAIRVADAFRGEPASRYEKPGQRYDICHPNQAGHRRIGDTIATAVRALIASPPSP